MSNDLKEALKGCTLARLQKLSSDSNLLVPKRSKKSAIIDILLDNRNSLPLSRLGLPELSSPTSTGPHRTGSHATKPHPYPPPSTLPPGGTPPLDMHQDLLKEIGRLVASSVASAMTPYDTMLRSIGAKSNEEAPIPAVGADAVFLSALHHHPTIQREVMNSIVDETFGFEDLWKMDTLQENTVNTSTRVPTGGIQQALARWTTFCQLRDLVQPGSARAMIGHAKVLIRLQRAFPNSTKAVLDYHRYAVTKRLNLGARFELSGWELQDEAIVNDIFLPVMAQQSQGIASTSSSSSRPTKRPLGNPVNRTGGLRQGK